MHPDTLAVLVPAVGIDHFLFHDKFTWLFCALVAIILALLRWHLSMLRRWGDQKTLGVSEYGFDDGYRPRLSRVIAQLQLWLIFVLIAFVFYSDMQLDWLGAAKFIKKISISGGL